VQARSSTRRESRRGTERYTSLYLTLFSLLTAVGSSSNSSTRVYMRAHVEHDRAHNKLPYHRIILVSSPFLNTPVFLVTTVYIYKSDTSDESQLPFSYDAFRETNRKSLTYVYTVNPRFNGLIKAKGCPLNREMFKVKIISNIILQFYQY
jgi:hypothetical protein